MSQAKHRGFCIASTILNCSSSSGSSSSNDRLQAGVLFLKTKQKRFWKTKAKNLPSLQLTCSILQSIKTTRTTTKQNFIKKIIAFSSSTLMASFDALCQQPCRGEMHQVMRKAPNKFKFLQVRTLFTLVPWRCIPVWLCRLDQQPLHPTQHQKGPATGRETNQFRGDYTCQFMFINNINKDYIVYISICPTP